MSKITQRSDTDQNKCPHILTTALDAVSRQILQSKLLAPVPPEAGSVPALLVPSPSLGEPRYREDDEVPGSITQ